MAKYEARGNVPPGKVQRAFYLSRELADILRIEAAKRNVSQSAIVETALRRELGVTRADEIATRMGGDGTIWETEDGTRLEDLLPEATSEKVGAVTLYRFSDGSGIVVFDEWGTWATLDEARKQGLDV